MRESVPAPRLTLHPTPEQLQLLHEAAALLGWTLHQYILSTALDAAERDLHTHHTPPAPATPDPTPFTTFATIPL
ncbi:DUF1778 domain-containing protein [Actinomadura flavalba]|uniref:type II toxin -antitoxin system TacA 1-like antitoxin n=1 Tax=Actinomadura flavalba TaxID=1120938 RepID=UPI000369144B|nr:DUF1778 domain-containing protein [Actinomadura flavalba]